MIAVYLVVAVSLPPASKYVYGRLAEGNRRAIATSMSQTLFGTELAAVAPAGTKDSSPERGPVTGACLEELESPDPCGSHECWDQDRRPGSHPHLLAFDAPGGCRSVLTPFPRIRRQARGQARSPNCADRADTASSDRFNLLVSAVGSQETDRQMTGS